MSVVDDIEAALVIQWSHLGRWPKGELHETGGIVWFETPITALPYNGVIRTHLPEQTAAKTVERMIARFHDRGVEFFWFAHPTATPPGLDAVLAAGGLRPVETMTGMSLDLDEWHPAEPRDPAAVEEVRDERQMADYTELTLGYWEIADGRDAALVREVHDHWGPARANGLRVLALQDGVAAGKAYLSLAGPAGIGSIYGMCVRPSARGRGVASALTAALLDRARDAGCRRVVLHATDMARDLYARIGFAARCEITVFATAPVWSED